MKIQTIFEAFENFRLGRNSLDVLYSWIVTGLEKVISPGQLTIVWDSRHLTLVRSDGAEDFYSLNEDLQKSDLTLSCLTDCLFKAVFYFCFNLQVDREDLPSKCKNVPHIDNILLAQLETQIEKLLTKQ